MFTGIIEATGKVLSNQKFENSNCLVISTEFDQLHVGESIAVNGVCLTLLPCAPKQLSFDVSPETLQCTTLANLAVNDAVNLERAMLAAARFGGHYVSGHVDAVAQVVTIRPIKDYIELELAGFDAQALLYLVPKGSITVEGVSLTINAVVGERIKLMLIPHTLSHTTLGLLKKNQWVNIEFDYLARLVAYQLERAGLLKMGINSESSASEL